MFRGFEIGVESRSGSNDPSLAHELDRLDQLSGLDVGSGVGRKKSAFWPGVNEPDSCRASNIGGLLRWRWCVCVLSTAGVKADFCRVLFAMQLNDPPCRSHWTFNMPVLHALQRRYCSKRLIGRQLRRGRLCRPGVAHRVNADRHVIRMVRPNAGWDLALRDRAGSMDG